jgi:hypothetical protein
MNVTWEGDSRTFMMESMLCATIYGEGKGRGDWEWDVIRVVGQILKSETINELVVALFGSFVTKDDGCKEINRGAGQVATRTQGGTVVLA